MSIPDFDPPAPDSYEAAVASGKIDALKKIAVELARRLDAFDFDDDWKPLDYTRLTTELRETLRELGASGVAPANKTQLDELMARRTRKKGA